MIINKLPQTIYEIRNKKITTGRTIKYTAPAGDVVVFSGKKRNPEKNKNISQNVSKAIELADKLSQIPLETPLSIDLMSKIIAQNTPEIKIQPINELSNVIQDAGNYGAFYTGNLTENFNIANEVIYLNTSRADLSDIHRLSVIKDMAHEYTHAMQMREGKSIEFLKSAANNNYEYAKAIQGLGDLAFKPIDNEIQAYGVLKVFNNPNDIMSNHKYGFFYPREQEVSKRDILDSLGLKNEKEFKELIIKHFNNAFDQIYNIAASDPIMSRMIPEKNYNKLRNRVKAYCQISAIKEKEAYTSESIISKKYLKTDKSLNIDIFPLYYEMVANALKES